MKGFWQGGVSYFVDKFSGLRATEFTPPELREERVIKNVHSILYWVDRNDPLGPAPSDPNKDSQFAYWEYGVRLWASNAGITEESNSVIPLLFDSSHDPSSAPVITILSPSSQIVYKKNARIAAEIKSVGRFPLSRVDYLVNGALVGTSSFAPWNFYFTPAGLNLHNEENTLTAIAYDTALNRAEKSVTFKIDPKD